MIEERKRGRIVIRIGICDDDIQYMKNITQIVRSAYEEAKTFDESCECILYSTGKDLIDNFVKDGIDIFFLDIECGEMSGFNIARELHKRKKDLGIVYITNHPHYASEAYVCRPLGFVKKGSIEEDIKTPMMNIIEFLEDKKQKIIFEANKCDLTLYVTDILAVEAFDHVLRITLMDKNIECNGPLSRYERILENYGFIKISRSILVNKKYITNIETDQIYLCDRVKYIISRRRVKEVREKWGKEEGY